jgi:hypothetical protein
MNLELKIKTDNSYYVWDPGNSSVVLIRYGDDSMINIDAFIYCFNNFDINDDHISIGIDINGGDHDDIENIQKIEQYCENYIKNIYDEFVEHFELPDLGYECENIDEFIEYVADEYDESIKDNKKIIIF